MEPNDVNKTQPIRMIPVIWTAIRACVYEARVRAEARAQVQSNYLLLGHGPLKVMGLSLLC